MNVVVIVAISGIVIFQELNYKGKDGDSATELLLTAEFYLHLFEGVATDTIAQLVLWCLPLFTWFPFVQTGNDYKMKTEMKCFNLDC